MRAGSLLPSLSECSTFFVSTLSSSMYVINSLQIFLHLSPLLEESETHLNHVTHTFLWCLPLTFVSGALVNLGWQPPLGWARISVAILVARGAGVAFLSLKVMAAPLLVVPPAIISAGLSIRPALSHLLLGEWDSQVEVHHNSRRHCLGAHDDLHTMGVKDIATSVYLKCLLVHTPPSDNSNFFFLS